MSSREARQPRLGLLGWILRNRKGRRQRLRACEVAATMASLPTKKLPWRPWDCFQMHDDDWKLGQVFYHFYQQSMLCWLSRECPWSLGSFKLILSKKSKSSITRLNNHIMQLRSECWIVIGVWHCWHTSNWRPNDLDFSLSSFLTQCLFAHLANYVQCTAWQCCLLLCIVIG